MGVWIRSQGREAEGSWTRGQRSGGWVRQTQWDVRRRGVPTSGPSLTETESRTVTRLRPTVQTSPTTSGPSPTSTGPRSRGSLSSTLTPLSSRGVALTQGPLATRSTHTAHPPRPTGVRWVEEAKVTIVESPRWKSFYLNYKPYRPKTYSPKLPSVPPPLDIYGPGTITSTTRPISTSTRPAPTSTRGSRKRNPMDRGCLRPDRTGGTTGTQTVWWAGPDLESTHGHPPILLQGSQGAARRGDAWRARAGVGGS